MVTVPTARQLGSVLRRTRRARRAAARTAGELPAGDWYTAGLAVFVIGGLVVQSVRWVAEAAPMPDEPGVGWLLMGLLLVAVGVALRAALELGPVVAGPAVCHWVLATPVDRRALLTPRYATSATGAAALGAGTAWLAAVVAEPAAAPWWPVTGAGVAAGLYAAAVLLQTRRPPIGRSAATGVARLGGVLALVALVVPGEISLVTLPAPAVAVGAVAFGAVLLGTGWQRLAQLDRAALGAGSGLAIAVQTAGTFLDPGLLLGLLEERRWRAARRGRSRPGAGTGLAALAYVDARRALRTPGAVALALGLLLVLYAGAAVLPTAIVPAISAVAVVLVATRVASGLRTVIRSRALRSALGGSNRALVMVHLVAPLIVSMAWTAAVLPALVPMHPLAMALLPTGAVAVVYRTATRTGLNYGAAVFETGFGTVPMDLVRQLLRGPVLLAMLVTAQLLLAS
jgi:Family of unknown function (DUF6297)